MADAHPLARLETLALIAIGGFAGSNLRFFSIDLFSTTVGILLANVLGSFLLGLLVYESRYLSVVDRRARLLFTTGFLSSFTTYSGFAFGVATAGDAAAMLAIVAANYVLALGGVLAGRWLALELGGEST